MVEISENEVLLKNQDQWLHFSEPHRIFVADKLDNVIPALREIERSVDANEWHAAGFISYEAASAFDPALRTRASIPLPDKNSSLHSGPEEGFPYLWFGLYPKPRPVILPRPAGPREILNWQPISDRATYNAAIAGIREYIADGRTYQVNYTMRLRTDFDTSAWEFFLHIAGNQNTHAAYVDAGRYVICSASPELFFQLDGKTITSRPMKGTVKRGRTTTEDQQQADWLKASEKNRAENVMIVDMIRNDMGRIAEIGSVHVPDLFNTERYPTLWQMISTVTAQTNASIVEIFRALFPCASITGAPKVSTMRIISELETTPRKIYTGAIGYLSPNRQAKFSVAIRTAIIDRERMRAEYGIGGGIVWDSTSADEYSEALLKARILTEAQPEFDLLETMLWTPQDGYFLGEKHVERLLDSADYFEFKVSRQTIELRLAKIAERFDSPQRVRLLLNKEGNVKVESEPHLSSNGRLHICLAKNPVNSETVLPFHKTTQRDIYNRAREDVPHCDDVLLHNERGELTEFTIANLVLELDGELVTPPIHCGLLPGVFRAHLVETGQVGERVVPVQRLRDCTKIFRVNSVRKWERVQVDAPVPHELS